MCACVRGCVRACVRACVCVCVLFCFQLYELIAYKLQLVDEHITIHCIFILSWLNFCLNQRRLKWKCSENCNLFNFLKSVSLALPIY